VVLDGYQPQIPLREDLRVLVLHHGSIHNNLGMRPGINKGVAVSHGDYIMKIDEHCMVDKGFDLKLKADCEDNWLVAPRMFGLNAESWEVSGGKNPYVDNMFFSYPYLNFRPWNAWTYYHKDILIDDCLGFAGSCYFMSRKHWSWLGGLDDKNYGKFHYESQEICLKTWLGGGRVVTNKKTWYAHWYRRAKGYGFTRSQYHEMDNNKRVVSGYVHDYWPNNRWDKRVHDFEWLIERFWPVQTWPSDWKQRLTNEGVIKNET